MKQIKKQLFQCLAFVSAFFVSSSAFAAAATGLGSEQWKNTVKTKIAQSQIIGRILKNGFSSTTINRDDVGAFAQAIGNMTTSFSSGVENMLYQKFPLKNWNDYATAVEIYLGKNDKDVTAVITNGSKLINALEKIYAITQQTLPPKCRPKSIYEITKTSKIGTAWNSIGITDDHMKSIETIIKQEVKPIRSFFDDKQDFYLNKNMLKRNCGSSCPGGKSTVYEDGNICHARCRILGQASASLFALADMTIEHAKKLREKVDEISKDKNRKLVSLAC